MKLALIWNFTRQDLKDRYAGSILGTFWAFLGPLSNILMFTLIFSQIMGAKLAAFGGEFEHFAYSIYLVAGMVPWLAFAICLANASA